MALPWENHHMSVEEYFQLRESDPDHRYEYIDGEVYMMTGGSVRHCTIGNTLGRIIGNLLEDSPYVVFNSDACFQVAEERYVCPDLTVSCDPRDSDESSEEEDLQTIQYPRFVAEVLSPSTTARDRGIKAALYQEHPTLQEFLLVETKAPKVQLYRRESNNRWTLYLLTAENEIELTSLGIHFPAAALYRKTRLSSANTQ